MLDLIKILIKELLENYKKCNLHRTIQYNFILHIENKYLAA